MKTKKIENQTGLEDSKQEISAHKGLFDDIEDEVKVAGYYDWDNYEPDLSPLKKALKNGKIQKEELLLLKRLFAERPIIANKELAQIQADEWLLENEPTRRFDVLIAVEDWVHKKRMIKRDKAVSQDHIKKLNELIHKEEERLDVKKKPTELYTLFGVIAAGIIALFIFRRDIGQTIGINLGDLGKGKVTETNVRKTEAIKVVDKAMKKNAGNQYSSNQSSQVDNSGNQSGNQSSDQEGNEEVSNNDASSTDKNPDAPTQFYIDRNGRKREKLSAQSHQFKYNNDKSSRDVAQRDGGEISSKASRTTRGSIQQLIQRYVNKGAALSGTVTCSIIVDASGNVTSVNVSGGNMPSELRSEIRRVLQSMSFSSAPGSSSYSYSWSFNL